MDIIDIHAHLFSRGFFEALSGGDEEALVRATRQAGIALPPGDISAHTDRWLSEMDVHGVSRLVMFASVPEEIPAVRQVAARSGGGSLAAPSWTRRCRRAWRPPATATSAGSCSSPRCTTTTWPT